MLEEEMGKAAVTRLWTKGWPAEHTAPEMRVNILKAVGTDEDRLQDDARHILDWVRSQPLLRSSLAPLLAPPERDDRSLLLIQFILVASKNDVERSKRTLERYAKSLAIYPRLFPAGDFAVTEDDLWRTTQWLTTVCAPRLRPDGLEVMLVQMQPGPVSELDLELCSRVMMLKNARAMYHDLHSAVSIVCDMRHLSARHVLKMARHILTARDVLHCVLNVAPMRIREVHMVNTPSVFRRLMALLLPFIKEKIRQRITIHHSLESLHEAVSPEYLPCDLDGCLPSCLQMEEKLINTIKWDSLSASINED